MSQAYRVLKSAGYRIDDIYAYSLDRFGAAQAQAYITGLFACFEKIAAHQVQWRPIPADYQVAGYFTYYESHMVFWRELSDGAVGVFAILSQRMDIPRHLRRDAEG